MRNKLKLKTLIIGNGDVKTLKEARDKCKKYVIDGVMIGRGIFENVGFFSSKEFKPREKINLLAAHLRIFKKTYGESKHFALMKKFVKCYVNNFNGATQAREKLMKTKTLDELIKETRQIISV